MSNMYSIQATSLVGQSAPAATRGRRSLTPVGPSRLQHTHNLNVPLVSASAANSTSSSAAPGSGAPSAGGSASADGDDTRVVTLGKRARTRARGGRREQAPRVPLGCVAPARRQLDIRHRTRPCVVRVPACWMSRAICAICAPFMKRVVTAGSPGQSNQCSLNALHLQSAARSPAEAAKPTHVKSVPGSAASTGPNGCVV
jgi:hypothetical protein